MSPQSRRIIIRKITAMVTEFTVTPGHLYITDSYQKNQRCVISRLSRGNPKETHYELHSMYYVGTEYSLNLPGKQFETNTSWAGDTEHF